MLLDDEFLCTVIGSSRMGPNINRMPVVRANWIVGLLLTLSAVPLVIWKAGRLGEEPSTMVAPIQAASDPAFRADMMATATPAAVVEPAAPPEEVVAELSSDQLAVALDEPAFLDLVEDTGSDDWRIREEAGRKIAELKSAVAGAASADPRGP
jgi:hypothetical protein